MRQTITLKLKPYLQEFLVCKLHDNAHIASRKNLIGAMLAPLIEYTPKDHVFERKKGPDYFTLEITQNLGLKDNRGNLYISETNLAHFERSLKIYFNEIFLSYVNDKVRYNNEIKKCILMFCSDYNISFNYITYEMLKKKYYREQKNSKKQKKLSPKLSLCCPLIFLLL